MTNQPIPFIDHLQDFLCRVAANNSREWLAANRAEYDDLRQQWFEALDRVCMAMSQWMPEMAGQTGRQVSYRFYRDTRFSPDKSPLKCFFSAAFAPDGRSGIHAGYYLQIGLPDSHDTGLWGGIYCPEPQLLRKLRHAIVDNIEEFQEIITAPELLRHYPSWVGNSLSTAPKGWDRNHPHIDLLRLKEYGRHCTVGRDFFALPDWPEQAAARFEVLKPLIDFLNYSIDE